MFALLDANKPAGAGSPLVLTLDVPKAFDSLAYFTRDPESSSDPATLLRWAPDDASLTVAYASKATGNAFLSPPRCGGDHLTVTAYSQAGDQQVTADLG